MDTAPTVVLRWTGVKIDERRSLAIDVNGNSVFIPDGILTIKDKHGEWCINASLAK